jgi:hypothetical protein
MTTEIIGRPPDQPAPERRWRIVATFVAVALLALTMILIVVARSDNDRAGGPQPATPAASGAPATVAPAGTPSTGPPATRTGQPTVTAFRFLPLWPFGSAEDAVAWQAEAGTAGHQPWRLDASATALSFTTGFLDFTNVDRAVGVSYAGDEAWVKVGYRAESGHDVTAAEVHLARIGDGANRPWEVVGTRDSTLSLTSPPYGSTVTSPVTMGGRITGVDESLRLQVRARTATGVLGEVVGIGAGGENEPWTGRVSFSTPIRTVLTLVVSTGGHAGSGIERFAIMGVRAG